MAQGTKTSQPFNIGDEVVINPSVLRDKLGIVFLVKKLPVGSRGVNYILEPKVKGTSTNVRTTADCIMLASDAGELYDQMETEVFVSESPGTIVKTKSVKSVEDGTLMVVLDYSRKGNEYSKVTFLNDTTGKYFPAMHASKLQKVETKELVEILSKMTD